MPMRGVYGKELILDLHDCNVALFNRAALQTFMELLCERIGMVREDLHFWDDLDVPEDERETEPHLVGTSVVQFIRTSNITIHTLDLLKRVYLNVFSCRDFDATSVASFAEEFFGAKVVHKTVVDRV